jgi:hypothetical protein
VLMTLGDAITFVAQLRLSVTGLPTRRLSYTHRHNITIQTSLIICIATHEYSTPLASIS